MHEGERCASARRTRTPPQTTALPWFLSCSGKMLQRNPGRQPSRNVNGAGTRILQSVALSGVGSVCSGGGRRYELDWLEIEDIPRKLCGEGHPIQIPHRDMEYGNLQSYQRPSRLKPPPLCMSAPHVLWGMAVKGTCSPPRARQV